MCEQRVGDGGLTGRSTRPRPGRDSRRRLRVKSLGCLRESVLAAVGGFQDAFPVQRRSASANTKGPLPPFPPRVHELCVRKTKRSADSNSLPLSRLSRTSAARYAQYY